MGEGIGFEQSVEVSLEVKYSARAVRVIVFAVAIDNALAFGDEPSNVRKLGALLIEGLNVDRLAAGRCCVRFAGGGIATDKPVNSELVYVAVL